MIIKSAGGVDVKLQASEWGNESKLPAPGASALSDSGTVVTSDTAMGLPAVSNVIRSPADLIASLPFMTYRDYEQRERAEDTWQWDLLHEKPWDECDPFEFFYDLVVSVEAAQNAFVQKIKQGNRVIGLEIIDPQRVRCYRGDDGTKRFDIYSSPTQVTKGLTTGDVLHVRGFTPRPGGVAGVSLIEMHRNPLGAAAAMQRFEGDFFRNSAVPPFYFTGAANKEQATEILAFHNSQHRGVGNQHKAGALWGNTDIKPLPISLRDAMFIEAKNMSIEDVCRIWRWPRRLLEIGELNETSVDLNIADAELLKLYLLPRIKRIERAFNADPDLYYGTDLFGEFLTAALERGDVHTRYDAYRLARQGGWVTANELRKLENFPPHPDGDELQVTPVGGAPNQPAAAIPPDTQAEMDRLERSLARLRALNGEATVEDFHRALAGVNEEDL